ncbi:trehalose operon repressor TreR [Ewingella americana]|uniref:trehalose operon repressor TreR n=1 Tax=Ewingella americana TaxID=41202 RepID=UPI001639C760|nr:trehalose operon repressor TreR [Ewingella americana]QMV53192.1 HTH-type transcriptional regulator TreR [Ewingella americana]
MQNRLTINDIARLSGVGKSTVSRVLNNEGNVSPRTRERVLAVIEQHNFSPSKSARAMRGFSDKIVAIIVSRLDSPSENQAVRAMLPLFYEQGYDPIVMESQFSAERVQEHLQVLKQRNIDGVVLFGFTGLDVSMLQGWQDNLVMMAREMPQFSSVCYDDAGAVRLLMDTLLEKGHRQISFIGVSPQDTTTGQLRFEAYQSYCAEHGLTPHMALGKLNYESGFELISQVLLPETDAVICASDTIALGAQKYLQQQNISGVQVCGIGNNPLLRFLFPNTFSVELGYGKGGESAARQLLVQLSQKTDLRQIIIPGQLAS